MEIGNTLLIPEIKGFQNKLKKEKEKRKKGKIVTFDYLNRFFLGTIF